nr:hypothetical protein [Tanacetum cinerariifolium]
PRPERRGEPARRQKPELRGDLAEFARGQPHQAGLLHGRRPAHSGQPGGQPARCER